MKKYEYACIVERVEINSWGDESEWTAYCRNTPDYLDEALDKAGYVTNRENWELSHVPYQFLGDLGFELKTSIVFNKQTEFRRTDIMHFFLKEKE